MTERERFLKVFRGEKVDRIPCYYFGTWHETKALWKEAGIEVPEINVDYGPQLEGMDGDWEKGMWNCHGFVNHMIISGGECKRTDQADSYTVEYPTGAVVQYLKSGAHIAHTLKYALEPTRESWDRFKKFLDPRTPGRYTDNLIEKAKAFNNRTNVSTFMGASLYGYLREYMGVEELSVLMYTDPELLKDMVEYMADFFIELHRPYVKYCGYEFVYIFEDCCGSQGPLFGPGKYAEIFDGSYKKIVKFYKEECGIPFVLLDSDGRCDELIPSWLGSGIDIIFPVEAGTWNCTPGSVREKFGRDTAMLGGVDKFKLKLPEKEMEAYLRTFLPCTAEGRYIPIPDHRIPPEISIEDMKRYIRVFHKVFG